MNLKAVLDGLVIIFFTVYVNLNNSRDKHYFHKELLEDFEETGILDVSDEIGVYNSLSSILTELYCINRAGCGNFTNFHALKLVKPRIRQLRIQDDSCTESIVMKDYIAKCYASYDFELLQKSSSWTDPSDPDSIIGIWSDGNSNSLSFAKSMYSDIRYESAGYITDLLLPPSHFNSTDISTSIESQITYLKSVSYFDAQTRLIAIDTVLLNPSTSIIASVVFGFEQFSSDEVRGFLIIEESSALQITTSLQSSSRDQSDLLTDVFIAFVLEMVFLSLVSVQLILVAVNIFLHFKRRRTAVMPIDAPQTNNQPKGQDGQLGWQLLDVSMSVLSCACLVMRLVQLGIAKGLSDDLNDAFVLQSNSTQASFINIDFNIAPTFEEWMINTKLESVYSCLQSILSLVLVFSLLRLLKATKRLAMIVVVFLRVLKFTCIMLVSVFIVVVAFAGPFKIIFGKYMYDFRTYISSMGSLVRSSFSPMDVASLLAYDSYVGPVVLIAFTLTMVFLVINLFAAAATYAMSQSSQIEEEIDSAQIEDRKDIILSVIRWKASGNKILVKLFRWIYSINDEELKQVDVAVSITVPQAEGKGVEEEKLIETVHAISESEVIKECRTEQSIEILNESKRKAERSPKHFIMSELCKVDIIQRRLISDLEKLLKQVSKKSRKKKNSAITRVAE